jgi:hypothetical protein
LRPMHALTGNGRTGARFVRQMHAQAHGALVSCTWRTKPAF